MTAGANTLGNLGDWGREVDMDLRARVQAYLDGRIAARELYDWTFDRVEALLKDPSTCTLAGAVLGGAWSIVDGKPEDALKADLRKELGQRASSPR